MLAPGTSLRHLSGKYGVSISAAHRHKTRCLPTTAIAEQAEQEEQRRGQSLAEFWQDLKQRFERIAADAKRAGDQRAETAATRELTRLMDLAVRAASELQAKSSASAPLHEHKDFAVLTGVLFAVLSPYPEAEVALRNALASIAAQGGG